MGQLEIKFGSIRNPILLRLEEYKGRKLLDIRKHYLKKESSEELIPTKKGISLNKIQTEELFSILNSNREQILSNFEQFNSVLNNHSINLHFGSTLGRNFQLIFENENTSVMFNESIKTKVSSENLTLISQIILSVYYSLTEVLDEDKEIEIILDVLDKKIFEIQW